MSVETLIEMFTRDELSHELVKAEHEYARCQNNLVAFQSRVKISPNEDARRDAAGEVLVWSRRARFAGMHLTELRAALNTWRELA